MQYLSVDFETRSTVDLRRTGVYPYAEHPDTDIICMAYAFGPGKVHVWTPLDGIADFSVPEPVFVHVREGRPLCAHNANFERVIWREILGPRYGFPVPEDSQWFCTAAEAAAMALPRSLAQAARVLGVEEQKDGGGRALMLQMTKPRAIDPDGSIHWWDEEDPEKRARLIEYCKQDVRTERAVAKRLRRLGEKERRIYLLDQKINDRGVRLDIPLIDAAQEVVKQGTAEVNEELKLITRGAVTKVTKVADLTSWLQDQGLDVDDIRKSTVRDALEEDLPGHIRCVLELRQEGGKSSTAKLRAMKRARCKDDRARGLLLYHGASTGRWSGKLIQPQNFPRGEIKNVEQYIPAILHGDEFDAPALEVVSSLLRGMLIPSEGSRFLAGDFSQIEARVLGWIAGEPYGELEYEKMAARIYGVPLEEVTPEQRQVGKVAVLGAGFQMGSDRYKATVKEWTGQEITDEVADRAITTYRSSKPGIPAFWNEIEGAAIRAVRRPGEVTYAGRDGAVRYVVRGQFLWAILPSSRPLAYALPQVGPKTTPWGTEVIGLSYMAINGYTRRWERRQSYGGLLTENVVQAAARDVLADALLRVEEAGYRPVLTVHDEILCDTPEGHGSLDAFLTLMRKTPHWAPGLEIEVEGWEGDRYRK